jgi:prevent-host-death family protein
MRLSESVKPISYLEAHAAEMIQDIEESRHFMVITQNGEAKAVLQDIKSYDDMQESLALLKMISQSMKSLQENRVQPVNEAFARIRQRIQKSTEL